MKLEFEMTGFGELAYFLETKFLQTEDGMILHKMKYVSEILQKFNMSECNSAATPAEINQKLEGCLVKKRWILPCSSS